jgi:hypothetical protein
VGDNSLSNIARVDAYFFLLGLVPPLFLGVRLLSSFGPRSPARAKDANRERPRPPGPGPPASFGPRGCYPKQDAVIAFGSELGYPPQSTLQFVNAHTQPHLPIAEPLRPLPRSGR